MADRHRLPDERKGGIHKFSIAGHDFYALLGLFEDGTLGECFLKAAREGSTLAGLLDTIGILFSLALQYGVPLKVITDKLSGSRFEPSGFTPLLGYARSPVDYLSRYLALRFLPPEEQPAEVAPPMVSIPPEEMNVAKPVALKPVAASDAPLCERCGALMRRMGSNNCWVCGDCGATCGSCGG